MDATDEPVRANRAAEILRLNSFGSQCLAALAGRRMHIVDDVKALHASFARSIAAAVRKHGRSPALILPWGPVGQYPVLARQLAVEGLSLRNCTLFFMDEYAGTDGKAVPADHPLSFRGAAERWLQSLEEALRPLPENVVFPNESNAESIECRIRDLGGIDVCFGGIGIHGHIAFNEPQVGVSRSGVRLVVLNEVTRTINSIRAGVGGDLENFPRLAWTLGMRQCLCARRIELYCRSDRGLDWAKSVLRLALLGTPGDDYPVTWVRGHSDYQIVTTRSTAEVPSIVLNRFDHGRVSG